MKGKIISRLKRYVLTMFAVDVALKRTISRKFHRRIAADVMVIVLVISLVFGSVTYSVFSSETSDDVFIEDETIASDESICDPIEKAEEKEASSESVEEAESIADIADNNTDTNTGNISDIDINTDAGESSDIDANTDTDKDSDIDADADTGETTDTKINTDADENTDADSDDIIDNEKDISDNDGRDGDEGKSIEENQENSSDALIKEDVITVLNDPEEENLRDMDISSEDYQSAYDGGEHSMYVIVNEPESGADIQYATSKEGSYSPELPFFMDAGEYTVYYRITAEGYKTYEGSNNVSISKRKVTIIPDENQKKEYGSEDILPYRYEADGLLPVDILDGELSREEGESVGAYNYTVGTLSNSNYDIRLADDSPTFNILGKPMVMSMITQDGDEFEYDGNSHAPVIKVMDGEKEMTEGTDYTFSGTLSSATPGKYLIFIQGLGNYVGYVAVSYEIVGEETLNTPKTPGEAETNNTEESQKEKTDTPVEKKEEVAGVEDTGSVKVISSQDNISTEENKKSEDNITTEEAKTEETSENNSDESKTSKKEKSTEETNEKESEVKNETKSDTADYTNSKASTGDNIPIYLIWLLMINSLFSAFLLKVLISMIGRL